MTDQLAKYVRLAHTPRDQLRILSAEIENQNPFAFGGCHGALLAGEVILAV
jgi:hypothetical protein